jgi:hypothetical protein
VVIYGGILWMLRVDGRDELSAMIRKLLGRFGVGR